MKQIIKKHILKYKKYSSFLLVFAVALSVEYALSGYAMPEPKVDEGEKIEFETLEFDSNSMQTASDLPKIQMNESVKLPANVGSSGAGGKGNKTVTKTKEDGKYKDGTYYGEGVGFAGNIKVCVVIKKGKIKDINVVKTQDGAKYMKSASVLLNVIIKKQSTNVDTVSGATYSSVGLIEAVRDALNKAKVKDEKKKTKEEKKTTEKKTEQNESETSGQLPYNDGVYYGVGIGYKGEVEVAITIVDHTLQSIVILSNEDDPDFFNRAKAVVERVLKAQSTNVDVVSNATYSSRGILRAIEDALKNAEKETKKATEEKTTQQATATQEKTTQEKTTEQATDSSQTEEIKRKYKDGTYTVATICYPDEYEDFDAYTMMVTVTIKDDQVVSVTDIYGTGEFYVEADAWYVNRAANGSNKIEGVVSQIEKAGNANKVDAVSNATCSSKAIIEAVLTILEDAKIGEEEI